MKIDNSFRREKIEIRSDVAVIAKNNSDKVSILDCFAGIGDMWKDVSCNTGIDLNITRIEKQNGKCRYPHLCGKSEKFLPNLDLTNYDIIDLDAYGIPFEQLEIIFRKRYTGIVVVTFCQVIFRALPQKMLMQLGFTKKMFRACKSLISRNGMQKFSAYLQNNGVRQITGYFNLGNPGTKNYFWFKM